MPQTPNTLSDLVGWLKSQDAARKLVFASAEGDIGAGFHVTELKHLRIDGIDCGARLASWTESLLQLLDGDGRQHMSVGTFARIAMQSVGKVPSLGEAPLFVEYAPKNNGLRRYRVASVEALEDRVQVHLSEDRALCKPAANGFAASPSGCCDASSAKSTCCA
ncbi:MAG: DUF6428 family protein [Paracoccaceae bacterium]|nr:DUF6428 family protein [Paracoccaceae bacterium]